MTELEIVVREWLIALRQMGRSPDTIEKYEWHLMRLVAWLAEQGVIEPQQFTKRLLRQWGAGLYEGGWSSATVKQAVSAVKSFLQWCREEEIVNEPLAGVLRTPVVRQTVQKTATEEDIRALLAVCEPGPKGWRDAAFVSLLVDSGLRASELCRLRISDVQVGVRLGEGFVNLLVVRGKGGGTMPAYFGQRTNERLRVWLLVRGSYALPSAEEVFVSIGGIRPGNPFTRDGLRGVMYKLCDKARIRRLSPHTLRRAFACIAHDAGASSRQIQEWGRWSDIGMVERYTQAYEAGRRYMGHSPVDFLDKTKTLEQ